MFLVKDGALAVYSVLYFTLYFKYASIVVSSS
jgi:hypothetical protein